MEILRTLFGIKIKYLEWDKKNSLPLYISDRYNFQLTELDGCRCLFITPIDELVTLPALKKQIERIQKIEPVHVVLKSNNLSNFRQKKMIEQRLPFLTENQVYLPFLGTYIGQERSKMETITTFMPSTQLLALSYLYSDKKKLYVSEIAETLPFSAMTISRAVKQLAATGLFEITKDKVNKVLEAKMGKLELFEKIKGYMITPVKEHGYIDKNTITRKMFIAGTSALAEMTMLNESRIKTYAVEGKTFNRQELCTELVDPDLQVEIQLWKYAPGLFAKSNIADPISVALSFADSADERIEQAIEEMLEELWSK